MISDIHLRTWQSIIKYYCGLTVPFECLRARVDEQCFYGPLKRDVYSVASYKRDNNFHRFLLGAPIIWTVYNCSPDARMSYIRDFACQYAQLYAEEQPEYAQESRYKELDYPLRFR